MIINIFHSEIAQFLEQSKNNLIPNSDCIEKIEFRGQFLTKFVLEHAQYILTVL